MKRIIDPDFLAEYAASNPDCEIAPYFRLNRNVAYFHESGQRVDELLFGGRMPAAAQIHHLCGSGNGAQRHDLLCNVVNVSLNAHEWLERHKIAGFVLCCWHKRRKGEMEWTRMSSIKGRPLPLWFECEQVIERCHPFPKIEEMRSELCRAPA